MSPIGRVLRWRIEACTRGPKTDITYLHFSFPKPVSSSSTSKQRPTDLQANEEHCFPMVEKCEGAALKKEKRRRRFLRVQWAGLRKACLIKSCKNPMIVSLRGVLCRHKIGTLLMAASVLIVSGVQQRLFPRLGAAELKWGLAAAPQTKTHFHFM